ncbi:hypothetical protein AA313_de0209011 [Arthrobotrys entomopaga]|nr:hypothetical protein AA313_de0209011 [Arthrobotrys entomopaga]
MGRKNKKPLQLQPIPAKEPARLGNIYKTRQPQSQRTEQNINNGIKNPKPEVIIQSAPSLAPASESEATKSRSFAAAAVSSSIRIQSSIRTQNSDRCQLVQPENKTQGVSNTDSPVIQEQTSPPPALFSEADYDRKAYIARSKTSGCDTIYSYYISGHPPGPIPRPNPLCKVAYTTYFGPQLDPWEWQGGYNCIERNYPPDGSAFSDRCEEKEMRFQPEGWPGVILFDQDFPVNVWKVERFLKRENGVGFERIWFYE